MKEKIIPRFQKELNINSVDFSEKALKFLIKNYTIEAGVRKIEQKISDLFYKKCVDSYIKKVELGHVVIDE